MKGDRSPISLATPVTIVKPESTERRAMGTAHEEARGCSCESGIMVLEQKPARKQGAPNRCCHRTNPTVSASSLTTPPGGQCRADPSRHPRPAPWPAPTPPEARRPRRRAGPGEHRRQDDDPGGLRPSRRRLESTTPMCCAPAGPPACSVSRLRLPPPWARSCAASGGAMSANWTG